MSDLRNFLTPWKNSEKPYVIAQHTLLSYRELYGTARHNAAVLNRAGIETENIALLAGNSCEYIVSYWSILFSGSTVIPLHVQDTNRELTNHLVFCDCNWLIYEETYRAAARELSNNAGTGLVSLGKDFIFTTVKFPTSRKKRANQPDIAIMLQTSGSTGNPKTVMLNHQNLTANTHSHIQSTQLTKKDTSLIVLPLCFSYTHTSQLLCHTCLGGTLVLYPQPLFFPRLFCDWIERYAITVTSLAPPMLYMLHQYRRLKKRDINSLRLIYYGSGPIQESIALNLMTELPTVKFTYSYGLTECSPRVTTLPPEKAREKIGSVGKPIPGVNVQIVDENHQPLPPGKIGELRVKGKSVTPGYYKNTSETQKSIQNQWLYTGDLAAIDEDGYIYILGRKKNIIISGGLNISPEELEQVLTQHPDIKDVIISGEFHPVMGEIPVALVTLKKTSQLALEDIHQFLTGKIAEYKWPKKLIIRDHLEVTNTGKFKRQGRIKN
ncbi:MAG: class I adenylate-forming enzyme family protein [Candidatus Aminicenantes bacterium]|jgi:long-chain acyl-CoA synthetase